MRFDTDSYPLSQSELGIYIECRTPTTAYNLPYLLPLSGLDPDRMADAVRGLFDIHPYLYTQFFTDEDGEVRKHIVPTPVEIPSIRVRNLDELTVRPCALQNAPLYRFALVSAGTASAL